SASCNVSQAADLSTAVRDYSPAWLIYCSAASASAWDPAPAELLLANEVDLIRQLAETASRLDCRLTVISSDAVFAGPRLFHEESCPPTGKTPQARHAREIELALKDTHALVVRSHVYGWSPSETRGNLVQALARQLLDGQAASLDGLRYATPILASDLADLLAKAFERKLEGLYHITGAERTNPYRFLGELASAMGIESFRQAADDFPFAT